MYLTLVATVTTPSPAPTPLDPDKVQPGVIGLAFFLASVAALALLGRSIYRRMKRLELARRPGGWAAPPPVPVPVEDADSVEDEAGAAERAEGVGHPGSADV